MNFSYKIEDNIDFYKEINNLDSDSDNECFENVCLLSNSKLNKNYIELNCGHKFNYISLINEVCSFKFKSNIYNKSKVDKLYDTMCPYCRKYTKGLIPFIPSEYNIKIKYVNTPIKYCFKNKNCMYNNYYNNKCDLNAYDSEFGTYCNKHHKVIEKNKSFINKDNWNDEMIFFYMNNKVNDIKLLLKEKKLKVSGKKNVLVERYFNNN
jgi:hypothetical protein